MSDLKEELAKEIRYIARTPYYELPWYYRIIVEPMVRVIKMVTAGINKIVRWLGGHTNK